MKTFITSVVCAVVLATLGTGMPTDPEPWLWFPSEHNFEKDAHLDDHLAPVCQNMTPIHNQIVAQTVPPPYKVTVDKTAVDPSSIVTVTVSGSESFKGIFVEARDYDQNLIGTFEPSTEIHTSIVNCKPGKNNALYFKDYDGVKELSLKWKAPVREEAINFRCTVVKNFNEFWVGILSPEVTVQDP